ncbi:hypothetical protein [Halomarina ordinaria]|uniref:PLAT domain-containing protein n=1 Tax=Halomarina ordinaria TaxID=3033939 RepID=A0ABD5U829_9EURY|nr:hypothetical protein [Halomarina sp. PSRA2]
MALETYRLVVEETDNREGITADVYGESDTIVETTRLPYEDYGLTAGEEAPDAREQEFTADVLTLTLQHGRGDGTFEVRVLGDGDELAVERIADDDWGLAAE